MSFGNPFENLMPQPPVMEGEEESPRQVQALNAGNNSAAEQGSNIPTAWKPTMDKPVPVVRCTATKRDGERCGRWSIRGGTVCKVHGGQLPNVIDHANAVVESARLRIYGMADDAAEVMNELIQPGIPDALRLKAAESILNRAGLKDSVDINVEVTHNEKPSEGILKSLAIMRERNEEAARRKAAEEAEEEEILEAEEIDEPEDD